MKIGNIQFNLLYKNRLGINKSVSYRKTDSQGDTFIKVPTSLSFGYNFSLKNPKGIPCAYCGKPTVVHDDILELTNLNGKDLINEINSFTSNESIKLTTLNSNEISIIKNIIQNHPNLNGRDILPVIYVNSREKMIQKQMDVYHELETLTESLACPELDNYIEHVKMQDPIINKDISLDELTDFLKKNSQIEFRKDVISNVIKLSAKYVSNDTVDAWTQAVKTVSKLPSSKTDPDTHLVKLVSQSLRDMLNESDKSHSSSERAASFYRNLFRQYLSSAEHIMPYSKNGASAASNYLATHVYCNAQRSNISFYKYTKSNPEILENILKYLKHVSMSLISDVNLQGLSDKKYIEDVKMSLRTQLNSHNGDPIVRNFLNELDKLYWFTNDNTLTYHSNEVRKQTQDMFADILKEDSYKAQHRMLNELYDKCLSEIKSSILKNLDNKMNHMDPVNDKRLIAIIKYYIEKNCVNVLFSVSKQNLNSILSDEFISNYRKALVVIFKKLMGSKSYEYSDEFLHKLAKHVSIKKTPQVYCLKILLTSKDKKKGKYNIPMIKKMLESKSIVPEYVKYQH